MRYALPSMEVEYPFAFPVVARYDDGSVLVHRTAASVGLCNEGDVRSGRVPKVGFYDALGRTWRPLSIAAVERTGKRVFGKEVVRATFSFAPPSSCELDELRRFVRDAIEKDDDVWNQTMPHAELLARLESARTFPELTAALLAATGA